MASVDHNASTGSLNFGKADNHRVAMLSGKAWNSMDIIRMNEECAYFQKNNVGLPKLPIPIEGSAPVGTACFIPNITPQSMQTHKHRIIVLRE